MSLLLYRLGAAVVRRRRLVIVVWFVALGAGITANQVYGASASEDFRIPGSEVQEASELLDERFPAGGRSGAEARVVFAPDAGTVDDPANAAIIERALDEIEQQPDVAQVVRPGVDDGPAAVALDGDIAFATVQYDSHEPDGAVERLVEVAGQATEDGVRVELGGELFDLGDSEIGGPAELVGVIVAVFVLLIAFGSVVAMGLPLLTALVGLGLGLSLIGVAARFVNFGNEAPVMATMIGVGVGIDYALFIVTRHREHLHTGMTVADSVARAIATAGQAVVFAGATVIIAILGLAFVGIPFVATLGYITALVVAVVVAAAITLLPALLAATGHRIDQWRVPGVRAAKSGREEHAIAGRWARQVAARPWPALIGSLAVLIALLVPFFSLRLGFPDAGNLPPSNTSRQAYDLLAEGFGVGFNGPVTLVVDLRGAADPDGATTALQDAAAADPGVAVVAGEAERNDAGDTAIVTVIPTSKPQDRATQELVERLRTDIAPAVESDQGVEVLVTGRPAVFIDLSNKITDRLPVFIGAVLVLSFLLLLVVFRSIAVPLKAVLVNMLGIGAAYGVVVAIFQWGWGLGLVRLEEAVPIAFFLPMFMFAMLFGLSMDYEVFLLSRVREEYLRSGNNNQSVAAGIAGTARVISAAAIIMVSVFLSFSQGDLVPVKMVGVGLAVAILLDATLIRLVLVPATMALLGDWNWWLPRWLEQRLPRLEIEGDARLPAPEYESEPQDDEEGALVEV